MNTTLQEFAEEMSNDNLFSRMINVYKEYDWIIKRGEDQRIGSCADIYMELINDYTSAKMLVDDGYCVDVLKDAVYHVYINDNNDKIFEGVIENVEDFRVIMKALGFKKK
jgi:hypothetical protein